MRFKAPQASESGMWERAPLEYHSLRWLFMLAGENVSGNQILLVDRAHFVWRMIIMKVIFQSKVGVEMLWNAENRRNQTGTFEAWE